MNSIKMSYRGFSFNANPETVKTQLSKTTATSVIPLGKSKSREISEMPAVIKGSGKFCGDGARAQAQMLLAVFRRKGEAYLFSPVLEPMKAYFTKLDFSVSAKGECIEYSFEFKEAGKGKSPCFDFGYTLALEGENLFDISYRTNTKIETIIDLNNFEHPFSVKEGDRVWLK